ncbi:hypothetical protein GCWU000324_01330 [Kingella oralis ATCC 51147]|uniref:Uncharacterized protein n=1 Tax=Kingella oralis ATCC 51147 TaxID=629741 RepID=C4GGR1_9NEIS|nr:hypothetical protein GCWU000324_01330 [Kingella oralis ATCC 51147]
MVVWESGGVYGFALPNLLSRTINRQALDAQHRPPINKELDSWKK